MSNCLDDRRHQLETKDMGDHIDEIEESLLNCEFDQLHDNELDHLFRPEYIFKSSFKTKIEEEE